MKPKREKYKSRIWMMSKKKERKRDTNLWQNKCKEPFNMTLKEKSNQQKSIEIKTNEGERILQKTKQKTNYERK